MIAGSCNIFSHGRGNRATRKCKQHERLFLIVLVLSLLVSVLLSSSRAFADGNKIDKYAETYYLMNGLKYCFNLDDGNNLSGGSKIASNTSNWFVDADYKNSDGTVVGNGYASFLPYDTQQTSCNAIVSNLATEAGYSDTASFTADIDTSNLEDSALSKVKEKVYGDNYDDFVNNDLGAAQYEAYSKAFFSSDGCGATVYSGDGTFNNVTTYDASTDDKKAVQNYTGNATGAINGSVVVFADENGSAQSKTCTEIASGINDNIDAYIAYFKDHPDETPSNDYGSSSSSSSDTTKCAVDGIGWLVCPVMNFFASVTDAAFGLLTQLLTVKASTITDSATLQAWQYMRNIANVMFVAVFLIIILSQVTGIGIDNYGIKKLLPKLIITAILVNLSYIICEIGVDLSNILGSSLKTLFDNIPVGSGSSSTVPTWLTTIGKVVTMAAGVGGAVAGALALSVPMLLAALLAILVTLLILVVRQALIVVLLVAAPLAFVMLLLPSTEKWFEKWRDMFVGLLLVYPMIGLVYGVSAFVGKLLNSAAGSDTTLQLTAMGASAIPLLVTPLLLKNSLNATGAAGKWASGLSARASSKGRAAYENSKYGKYRENEKNARNAAIRTGTYTGRGGRANPRNWRSVVHGKLNDTRLGGSKFNTYSMASDIAESNKAEQANIQAAQLRLAQMKLSNTDMNTLAHGGRVRGIDGATNDAFRRAAIQQMVASNNVNQINSLWDTAQAGGSMNDGDRRVFGDALLASSSKPAYFGGGAIAAMKNGTGSSVADTAYAAAETGAYSPEKITSADKDEIKTVFNEVLSRRNAGVAGAAGVHKGFVDNTRSALKDPILNKRLNKNMANMQSIDAKPYASI